ncbi:hypothetical protein NM208_g13063 [Fusarium decemcellulare]|uniref:Uncharacterized protein n=1 Tax=Fusarium decemcellulare TaxID=57161 RepID=A0ACC1RN89_9HYPO|nr:hypothetical protein NM208_g13063 [Fusarium decemcellulare]
MANRDSQPLSQDGSVLRLHVATRAVHADDEARVGTESFHYSRISAPNSTRFETVLSNIVDQPSITYSSGLAAFHAAMVLLNPDKIFMGDVYHGCQKIVGLLTGLTGLRRLPLERLEELGPRDVLYIETPVNPTGEAVNLSYFKERASAAGAYLVVDSTFAPPPLQNPFAFGADIVLHSGTKYFGGHSDML